MKLEVTNHNLSPQEESFIVRGLETHPGCRNLNASITLLKISELNHETRWQIRKIINQKPEQLLVLLSLNKDISLFAWRINAFYFLSFPLNRHRVKQMTERLGNFYSPRKDSESLRINSSGTTKIIHPSNINVITGKGNYCDFYTMDQAGKQTFCLRIQKVAMLLQHLPYLIRINSSLILNVNNLKRLDSDHAYFKGEKITAIKISNRTYKKLRDELLWINN